jgi:hypothetical protein
MQLLSKPLVLRAGPIILAACAGAAAMYAWQALPSKAGHKATAVGSMSTFIQELHKSPHGDKLPVQVIEGHN